MAKYRILAIASAALMLCSCGGNTEQVLSETVSAEITSGTVATLAETTTEKTTSAETTEAETTSADEENVGELPVITPLSELYDVYLTELEYPEVTDSPVEVKYESVTEDIMWNDKLVCKFDVQYPVISAVKNASAIDDEVLQKINESARVRAEDIYTNYKSGAEDVYNELAECEMPDEFHDEVMTTCRVVNTSGNILTIYYEDYYYGAGAVHGYEVPCLEMYDLTTGEQIFLADIVEDKEGLFEPVRKAIADMEFMQYEHSLDEYADYCAESDGNAEETYANGYGVDTDGVFYLASCNTDYRASIEKGCLCLYIAPYEYGSYADGIRRLEIPLDDVRQYFTDKGKALIEGIPSAKARSASLIEYKGQTFTTLEKHIPYDLFGDNNYPENGAYTEGDYIVMESMPKLEYVYIGGGTDLQRIAALKGLNWVGVISGISDITPLYDTGILISDWDKYLTEEQCEEYTARGGIVNR